MKDIQAPSKEVLTSTALHWWPACIAIKTTGLCLGFKPHILVSKTTIRPLMNFPLSNPRADTDFRLDVNDAAFQQPRPPYASSANSGSHEMEATFHFPFIPLSQPCCFDKINIFSIHRGNLHNRFPSVLMKSLPSSDRRGCFLCWFITHLVSLSLF